MMKGLCLRAAGWRLAFRVVPRQATAWQAIAWIVLLASGIAHTQTTNAPSTNISSRPNLSPSIAQEIYFRAKGYLMDEQTAPALDRLWFLADNGFTNPELLDDILSIYVKRLFANPMDPDALAEFERSFQKITNLAPEYELDALQTALQSYILLQQLARSTLAAARILELDDTNVAANYTLGTFYTEIGMNEQAYAYLIRATQNIQTPLDQIYAATAFAQLGDIALSLFQSSNAVIFYQEAAALSSLSPTLESKVGLALTQGLEFDLAKQALLSNTLRPEHALLSDAYLAVLFYTGDPSLPQALESQQATLGLKPTVQAYLQKDYPLALQLGKEGLAKDPLLKFYYADLFARIAEATTNQEQRQNASLHAGQAAIQANKSTLALHYLENLSNVSQMQPNIWWILGELYEKKHNLPAAESNYSQYLNAQGEDIVNPTLRLAYIAYAQDDTQKALQILSNGIAKKPTNTSSLHYMTGILLYQIGDHRDAKSTLQTILKQEPKHLDARLMLSSIYSEEKAYTKAIQIAEPLLEWYPSNASVLNHLAYTTALSGNNLEQALAWSLSSLAQHPNSLVYLDTLAWIYYLMDKPDEAGHIFQLVTQRVEELSQLAGSDEVAYHIGMYYQSIGKDKLARQWWERGLLWNPNNTKIQQIIATP